MARDVLLVGSVPVKGAAAVFELLSKHLGALLPRMPDGEQAGWTIAAWEAVSQNPALEVSQRHRIFEGGGPALVSYRLKPGVRSDELQLAPLGYARNAKASYAEFARLKDDGVIAPATRFQATIITPFDAASNIELEPDELLRIGERALLSELDEILATIPADQLTIQIDLASEIVVEEFRRHPGVYTDHAVMHAFYADRAPAFDDLVDSIVRVAAHVPEAVELGFHLCSIWRFEPSAGQDNQLHVDLANAFTARLGRRIDYIHMGAVPEHGEADYAPLKQLQLDPATTFYIGLIHSGGGFEGARRSIEAASSVLEDFGLGAPCGLGFAELSWPDSDTDGVLDADQPAGDGVGEVGSHSDLKIPLPDMLDLHRRVAEEL